ncbi:glutamate racemase [Anseongella ginsenosidimutans]|uniref:Glutamate racemase n=1 Tax=Anseongella ginsenosidimutans TaxID=496056 RepID=A0A4R3KNI2_9SPHI|nr:glutamate racemase [Anseongella ginsenosidimutans]QEC53675.1 glutamate racemase [Anseongella ginsenosidimutans]TCS86075.1 glutamate racemase [Anseongella ginsenosidimutans]
MKQGPIGIFDSGYGGLTVLKEIISELPEYDYLYLGDNARAPYGTRSYETVYQYTLECVKQLFDMGCQLVILACNTSSAKALRTIQQNDLPGIDPSRRVLGIIRPSAEVIGDYTSTGHIGILATPGTVASDSYLMEIRKFFPRLKVFQEACPMWVSLVENNEHYNPGANYFVQKHMDNLLKKSSYIDVILMACTHYPLLINKIKQFLPGGVRVLDQGRIVAKSLADYLKRHPEMETLCSKNRRYQFYTTNSTETFERQGSAFFGQPVHARHLDI